MDDKLILAVLNYPELFNVTLPNYRCTESRANAWRSISVSLGLPSEECKRKWKNLRDRYLKEVRMEIKSKRQGDIIQSKWKYRQLMNFIAPFTGSRGSVADICGNDDDDMQDCSDDHEADTALSESVKAPHNASKVPVSPSENKPHLAFGTQVPAPSQDTPLGAKTPSVPQITPPSKTGRKRKPALGSVSPLSPQSTNSPSKWLPKDNGASLPTRPRDEDELFMLSFVPALKRLAPQKRCETKMKIQQIMYEAEFNVAQAELQVKKKELGAQDRL
ncbi:uncharacterized protein ACNS7B_014382 [Menidia menidia]|uniref:(Atlantic silverside) hypothetical protein n=1 Tax=Menidia menidia TaxID=238744 RepID=A0A8S4AP11_9TELE|nr:unnamed protein product [Menidia menidia]